MISIQKTVFCPTPSPARYEEANSTSLKSCKGMCAALEQVERSIFPKDFFIFWRLFNIFRFVRRAVALRGSAKKITPVFPSIRVDLTPMHLRLRKCRPESLNSYMQKYNTMDFVTFWSWITNSPSWQRRSDSIMGRVWWPMYSSWGELLWVLSGGQVKDGGHVWNGHLWIHPILAVPLCHFQMIQAMRIE